MHPVPTVQSSLICLTLLLMLTQWHGLHLEWRSAAAAQNIADPGCWLSNDTCDWPSESFLCWTDSNTRDDSYKRSLFTHSKGIKRTTQFTACLPRTQFTTVRRQSENLLHRNMCCMQQSHNLFICPSCHCRLLILCMVRIELSPVWRRMSMTVVKPCIKEVRPPYQSGLKPCWITLICKQRSDSSRQNGSFCAKLNVQQPSVNVDIYITRMPNALHPWNEMLVWPKW
jgi:hypothetical protein